MERKRHKEKATKQQYLTDKYFVYCQNVRHLLRFGCTHQKKGKRDKPTNSDYSFSYLFHFICLTSTNVRFTILLRFIAIVIIVRCCFFFGVSPFLFSNYMQPGLQAVAGSTTIHFTTSCSVSIVVIAFSKGKLVETRMYKIA